MKNKLLALTLTSLCLTGCVSTYKQPITKNTASITVPAFKKEWKFFGGFSGGDVLIASKKDDGCGELEKISSDKIGEKDITVKIPANQDIFILVGQHFGNTFCHVEGMFTPETGKNYSVVFSYVADMCGAMILETDNNSKSKAVKLSKAYPSRWDGIKICSLKEKLCNGNALCLH